VKSQKIFVKLHEYGLLCCLGIFYDVSKFFKHCSRRHIDLNPDKDEEFWDYSFYDMIADDKANIQYILQRSEYSKVAYLGVSQGNTQIWAGMSHDPDWFYDRISIVLGVAPVSKMTNVRSDLWRIVCTSTFILETIKFLTLGEFSGADWISSKVYGIT
jgi:hypothetical protein